MSDVERRRAARRAYYTAQQGPFWEALNAKMGQDMEVAEVNEQAIFIAMFERATLAKAIDRLEWDESK